MPLYFFGLLLTSSSVVLQETHQNLADKKQLNVVEFRAEQGALPIVVAQPQLGARKEPEVEDDVPNTRLHWADVKASQGVKRSVWAGVKRTIWWSERLRPANPNCRLTV